MQSYSISYLVFLQMSHYVTVKAATWKLFVLSGDISMFEYQCQIQYGFNRHSTASIVLEVKLEEEHVVIFGLVRQLLRSQQQGHKTL